MRKTLAVPFVVFGASLGAASWADTPEPSIEEIVVTGEFPGPGLWQVTHSEHPGHTLWIVGDPPLLPVGMRFNSRPVADVASRSQEILMPAGASLKPDKKIGAFRMLTLAPAALKLRKNPDAAKLEDLISAPVYARWLAQKKLYLGEGSGLEKLRPFLAAQKLRDAVVEGLRLGQGGSWSDVWTVVKKNRIPVTTPTLEFTFKTDDLRGQLKAFSREKLADEECFERTVALAEALADKSTEEARARAWATGDLAKLQALPSLPDADSPCDQAIMSALTATTPIPTDLREQMDASWFAAADRSMNRNDSTLAFLPMSALLGERGYLQNLRQRGYEVEPPR